VRGCASLLAKNVSITDLVEADMAKDFNGSVQMSTTGRLVRCKDGQRDWWEDVVDLE